MIIFLDDLPPWMTMTFVALGDDIQDKLALKHNRHWVSSGLLVKSLFIT